jgi:hypothetical protein
MINGVWVAGARTIIDTLENKDPSTRTLSWKYFIKHMKEVRHTNIMTIACLMNHHAMLQEIGRTSHSTAFRFYCSSVEPSFHCIVYKSSISISLMVLLTPYIYS